MSKTHYCQHLCYMFNWKLHHTQIPQWIRLQLNLKIHHLYKLISHYSILHQQLQDNYHNLHHPDFLITMSYYMNIQKYHLLHHPNHKESHNFVQLQTNRHIQYLHQKPNHLVTNHGLWCNYMNNMLIIYVLLLNVHWFVSQYLPKSMWSFPLKVLYQKVVYILNNNLYLYTQWKNGLCPMTIIEYLRHNILCTILFSSKLLYLLILLRATLILLKNNMDVNFTL